QSRLLRYPQTFRAKLQSFFLFYLNSHFFQFKIFSGVANDLYLLSRR
ncbi:hypothetical protein X975_16352, partial [Stegodyphus mimosarum]